jgi:hypothetical protein
LQVIAVNAVIGGIAVNAVIAGIGEAETPTGARA